MQKERFRNFSLFSRNGANEADTIVALKMPYANQSKCLLIVARMFFYLEGS